MVLMLMVFDGADVNGVPLSVTTSTPSSGVAVRWPSLGAGFSKEREREVGERGTLLNGHTWPNIISWSSRSVKLTAFHLVDDGRDRRGRRDASHPA